MYRRLLPLSLYNNNTNYSSHIRRSHNLVTVKEADGVKNIILNDFKTRNSLSLSMMNCLIEEIKRNENDTNLRIIVLSSTGSVWSAGHNLKELSPDKSYEDRKSVFDKCHELINSIIKSPVPIIAKVDGLAAAAGLQLVSSCDITVCSDKSSFSTPGSSFGIFCSTPGISISRYFIKIIEIFDLI